MTGPSTSDVTNSGPPAAVEPPPQAVLLRLLLGYVLGRGLHSVVELGVADHLGREPRSARDIARAVGGEPEAVERLLHSLASVGVFAEPEPANSL